MPAQGANIQVTDEERAALRAVSPEGYVCAKLFDRGDFSEEGFLLFGRLEALCRKGLLRFVDRKGDSERAPGDVKMVFALADGAAERMRFAAA
jgi:hypothetical protein